MLNKQHIKKIITITLPEITNNGKYITIIKKSGLTRIIYKKCNSNFKNTIKIIWYNIIYFIRGKVEIKI